MLVVNIIAIIITFYLAYSLIYFAYVIYCATKSRLVDIENRIDSNECDYTNVFNIVVYAHNNEQTIPVLINALKEQDYNKEKYTINVILDNCTDDTGKVLEICSGTRLWRLNCEDGQSKGKAEAIRWFFDRIFINDKSDAFVFLNADTTLRPDFLNRLNEKINVKPVVSGITLNKNTFTTFAGRVIGYRKIFLNTVIYTGRNIAGFLNYLNDDIFAIKKDVLMQVRGEFVADKDFHFELPVSLSNMGIEMYHSSDIRVFKQYFESTDNVLKFFNNTNISKFILLKNYYKYLFSNEFSLASKEFLLSALYPGELLIILGVLLLTKFAGLNHFILGYKCAFLPLIYYFMLFIWLAKVAKFNFQKFVFWVCWILFSPVALIFNAAVNLQLASLKNYFIKKEKELYTNSDFYDVLLTNGDLELTCKLQIINEDALFRVVFWHGKQYMSSRKYLGIAEGIKEITDTLLEKGFALKICQNCGYFEFQNNGRVDCTKGNCYLKIIKKESKFPEQTELFYSCDNIIPEHAKDFVRKELDNNGD